MANVTETVEDATIVERESQTKATSEPTPAPAAAPAPQPAPAIANGGSNGSDSGIGIGIIGLALAVIALVVGVVALVLQFTQSSNNSGAVPIELASRLAVLESKANQPVVVDAAASSAPVAVDGPSRAELHAVREEINGLRQAVTDGMVSAARVESLVQNNAGQDATIAPRLSALEATVGQLSQAGVATPSSVADANARIDQLQQSINSMSTTTQQLTADLSGLQDALSAQVSDAVAQVDSSLSSQEAAVSDQLAAAAARLSDLSGQLEALQQSTNVLASSVAAQSEKNAASSARLLAVSRLRDALETGRGVQAEAEAVRLVTANDETLSGVLDTLQPVIAPNVPTLEALQNRFVPLWEETKLQADLAENAGNAMGQLVARTMSLVNIQRVDGEDEILALDGVSGDLARANYFMSKDRLDEAIHALNQLEGDAADALASFKTDLENRKAYSEVLADLDRWSLARLAADSAQ